MGGRRDTPILRAPREMCLSLGVVEKLHPFFLHLRQEPFAIEKPRKLSEGTTAGSGSCRQRLESPAQLLLSANAPSAGVPGSLNLLLLLCTSSFASETPPALLSRPAAPAPRLHLSPACAPEGSSGPGVLWRAKREGSY